MPTKKASYDKAGIQTLADNKPVVYRIQTRTGKDNFVGAAKRGRVDEIAEHLGCVPGSVVRIVQYESMADAKAAEQRIINRVKPKWNQRDWLGQDRRVRREADSEVQTPRKAGETTPGSASQSAKRVAKTVVKVQAKIDSGEHVVTTPPDSPSAYQRKLEAIRANVENGVLLGDESRWLIAQLATLREQLEAQRRSLEIYNAD